MSNTRKIKTGTLASIMARLFGPTPDLRMPAPAEPPPIPQNPSCVAAAQRAAKKRRNIKARASKRKNQGLRV